MPHIRNTILLEIHHKSERKYIDQWANTVFLNVELVQIDGVCLFPISVVLPQFS